jgi:hypothetical protein
MKTISNPATLAALAARLESVTPVAERHWGTITPHQMVVHLGDAADAVLQRRPWPTSRRKESRLMKWFALSLPIKWPHGVKAGADPAGRVLAEEDFPANHRRALDTLAELASVPADALAPWHPLFGAMTRAEWLRWGWLHTDHHLRQFGR